MQSTVLSLGTRHQDRTVRVADDALRDAPHELALYGAQSPAAYDDKSEASLLLAEPDYLIVRVAQPNVPLRDGPPVVSELERGESGLTSPLERVEP